MFDWNQNNRACKTTWSTLFILDQSDQAFADSGTIKMCELTFWALSVSDEMRRIQARTLSIQMHNIFRLIRKATLEPGVSVEQAVGDMFALLLNENKTMCDLAEANDRNYRFLGEKHDEI
jgi:hypothetical protein